MNINASIIDQQVRALAERQKAAIEEKAFFKNNDDKLRSAAFVVLVVKTLLDITEEEAVECLTEGGGDFGVDAVEVGEVQGEEFAVTLFQGKYKSTFDGESKDLLHKSSASNCQLHVVDSGDQAEAETETLSPVSIPFAQHTEHFDFAEYMFNHNAFPG